MTDDSATLRTMAEDALAYLDKPMSMGAWMSWSEDTIKALATALLVSQSSWAKEKAELEGRAGRLLQLLEQEREECAKYKSNWAAAYTSEGVLKGRVAELERQLAEADTCVAYWTAGYSDALWYSHPLNEWREQAVARHASRPVTAKE